MTQARPRPVVASEIIQLLLLCEPIWRAMQINSAVSFVGTVLICLAAAGLIECAVRGKKNWARELLAGLAMFALLACLIEFVLSFWYPDINVSLVVAIWLVVNLTGVGMLFTDSAERWFISSPLPEARVQR